MVDAGAKGRGGRWAADCKVPLEQVVFEGVGVEVRGGVLGELGGFLDCEERESVWSEWTRLGAGQAVSFRR